MQPLWSRAILVLGLAGVLLIGCQTTGKPKQSESATEKSQAALGAKTTSPSASAGKSGTASPSGHVASAASAKHKTLKAKAAARPTKVGLAKVKLPNLLRFFRLPRLKPISSLRAVLYATLGIIFLVVLAAIVGERVGRRRRLSSVSLSTRQRSTENRPRERALPRAS